MDDKLYKDYIFAIKELEDSLDVKKDKARKFHYRPKVSIITPVYNTDEKWLRLAIESVINQIYDNWELCIADGGSTKEHVRKMLDEYAEKDIRIKVKFLSENKGIAGNSNEALSLATGEFVGFLDHDDELHPDALYEVAALLNENQAIDFIYSDEDKISTKGERYEPHFKPDWSPDTFRSHNYICHFSAIRKKIIDEIGGFREGYEGSQDYDLFLRAVEKINKIVHIPKVLYHWRSHESSAAGNIRAKMYAYDNAKKALTEHLQRTGINGNVEDGFFLGTYRIRYHIETQPLVTIVIPTKDKVEVLRKCIESIINKSTYNNYKIFIVDNQSSEEETFKYYEELKDNSRIEIIKYDMPFNYSAINNYAVNHADSEYIILLNNDTEVITPDWIESMLEFARRQDVGVVGCLLFFPDDTIQHAGVIVGLGSVAGHPFHRFPKNNPGYFGRVRIIQNLSAVTGACMMVKKKVFQGVGGLDKNYSLAFNDIDLCMKIIERGYLVIYTPYAELYHHESLSRGYEDTLEKQLRFGKEIKFFSKRWGSIIEKGDPYYNPNLTFLSGDCAVKSPKELLGKEVQFFAVYSTLLEKNFQLNSLNIQLNSLNIQLNSLKEEKDFQIYNLSMALWEKDVQLNSLKVEKDFQIYNLSMALWEKDVQLTNLHNTVSEKDAYISKLEAIVGNKDVYMSSLETMLRDKNTHILNLESTLKDKEVSY